MAERVSDSSKGIFEEVANSGYSIFQQPRWGKTDYPTGTMEVDSAVRGGKRSDRDTSMHVECSVQTRHHDVESCRQRAIRSS